MTTLDRCVAHPSIQPDTVEALVQNVRGLMTDEEQRASSLMSRGSGLAGFAGVILALAGAAATSVNGYHGTLGIVLTGLSAAALVSLALAVVAVVVGLLLPPVGVWVGTGELAKYTTRRVASQNRVVVQATFLGDLVDSLEHERRQNRRGAAALRLGYAFLCVGLALVTVVAVSLTISGGAHG